MSALEMRDRVCQLEVEGALAVLEGLDRSIPYMADLDEELEASRNQ